MKNGRITKDYYFTAYSREQKRWFTWAGFTMKRLKKLTDAEGLIKLKKVYYK